MAKTVPSILKVKRPPGKVQRPHVVSGVYPYSLGAGAFRQKRAPTPVELVASYRAMTYSFANRNARAVASQDLRLYGTTRKGQKGASWAHRTLNLTEVKRLAKSYPESATLQKAVTGAVRIDQIVDHPIIDLLDWVNPWMSRFQLFELTQLYNEIVGYSFWTFGIGAMKRLTEIWPLPAWMCYPTPDFWGTDVVLYYVFTAGGGQALLPRDEVLYFRTNNLFDPYTQGFGPLRAAYELAEIWDKRTDYEDSVLSNRARPDAVLVAEDDVISPEEIARVNGEFYQNFGLSGAGKAYMLPGGYKVQPISWPPKDMGELALSKETKINLAAVFDIPSELVDQDAPRAAKDAALLDYARNGIKPRCVRMQEHLNSNFVNRFDDRLFLAYDDPVPADVKAETEKHGRLVAVGLESRNEARAEFGLPPVDGGDVLLVPNNLVPLDHALHPPDPRIVMPNGPARPEEVPGDAEEPSETFDDENHAGQIDEGEDEEFEEGDDVQSAKGLTVEGKQGRPFDVPTTERLLKLALRRAGLTRPFRDRTITQDERFRVLHELREIGRAWLRREARRTQLEIEDIEAKAIFEASKEKARGFFSKARRFVRNLIVAGALALGMPEPINQADAQAIDEQRAIQEQYLDDFEADVIQGHTVLAPWRAAQYGASVWSTSQTIRRRRAQSQGLPYERRVHMGEDDPCPVCVEQVDMGWQVIGTLADIGASFCRCNCHCRFLYGNDPEADVWGGVDPWNMPVSA